jgi:Raf kinase inhibitor-like YbhB/YbcL family protein
MQKFLVSFTLMLLILSGCSTPTQSPATSPTAPSQSSGAPALLPPTSFPASSLTLSSPSFTNGQPIPQKFTCQGENISPSLSWSGIPATARSLALVTEDPDASSSPFIHWVIYNISPTLGGLPEKVPPGAQVDGIGTQGSPSFGAPGYGGPCPPSGNPHHYYFRLYALDLDPSLPDGLHAAELQQRMTGHILAQAELMGTYQRQ